MSTVNNDNSIIDNSNHNNNNSIDNVLDDIIDVSSEDEEQVNIGSIINKMMENTTPDKLKELTESINVVNNDDID